MERKAYTTEEFTAAFLNNAFEEDYQVCGLAKLAESDSTIMFSPGATCGSWISIPIAAITKIEYIQLVPCKDHEHPFVCLTLKRPINDTDAIFVDLLRILQRQNTAVRQPPVYGTPALSSGNRGPHMSGPRVAGTTPAQPPAYGGPSGSSALPSYPVMNAAANPCGPYRRLCVDGDQWWCCDLHWNICCDNSNLGCRWCV